MNNEHDNGRDHTAGQDISVESPADNANDTAPATGTNGTDTQHGTGTQMHKPIEPAVATEKKTEAGHTGKKEDNVEKAKTAATAQVAPAAAPVVIRHGSGRWPAAFAVVLSLVALGTSGLLFVQGQNVLKTQALELDRKVDAAGLGESRNGQILQGSLAQIDSLAKEIQALRREGTADTARLDALEKAYAALVRSQADRVVDETEATLNLIAQQLVISGNVPVAVSLMEGLDNRLARYAQPGLLPVKQAVSADLAALKTRPYPDVVAASLRLSRLETAVSGLPLAADSLLQPGKTPAPVQPAASASWWQRTGDSLWNSLRGMVEVRRIDSNDAVLISPDQIFFLRENLRLRLLDARMALMQKNSEVYLNDLNLADAAVRRYFDADSVVTRSWLDEVAQLKTLNIAAGSEDGALSGSLAAVRRYQQESEDNMPVPASGVSASQASAPAAPEASAPAAPPVRAGVPSSRSGSSGQREHAL